MEDDLKKNENGRRPQYFLFVEKQEWQPPKKMEDDLKNKIKNGRRPQKINKKMENKPINQNQPNWLWHHCKFT